MLLSALSIALGGCSSLSKPSGPAPDTAGEAGPALEQTGPALPGDRAEMAAPAALDGAPAPAPEMDERPSPPPPVVDVWERVRAGFAFPPLRNQYVEYYEQWYQERPEFMQRLVERASLYLYHIVEEVEKRGMPTEIALLPIIESAFKPTAYSRAHAAGLWQFIPATGRRFGLKQNWWYDGRRDVVSATQAALDYLEFLNREFDGDWFHTLAAYNAGERRIQRAIILNRKRGKPTDYQHLRLKSETRRYVPKLQAVKNIVMDPARFGLRLAPISNRPYFTPVDAHSQIDLGVAADLAGLSQADFRALNPAFRRWATDPEGPHRLLVPVTRRGQFATALAELPKSQRMQWQRHRIRRGDTLSTIARRYGVPITAIRQANGLRGSFIRAGHDLIVPVAPQAAPSRRTRIARAPKSGSTGDPVVHHVRSGDTLWAIARRYDVYVKQLRRWNAIAVNDVLRLGQKIVIYRN